MTDYFDDDDVENSYMPEDDDGDDDFAPATKAKPKKVCVAVTHPAHPRAVLTGRPGTGNGGSPQGPQGAQGSGPAQSDCASCTGDVSGGGTQANQGA
jgi:hypothetical protein